MEKQTFEFNHLHNTTMENEYVFNYDEVKKRFESVPSTNLIKKKFKSTTYKSFFQPRTKFIPGKTEGRTTHVCPLLSNRIPQTERVVSATPNVTVQMHIVHVQPVMPVVQITSQTQQGFYIVPKLII